METSLGAGRSNARTRVSIPIRHTDANSRSHPAEAGPCFPQTDKNQGIQAVEIGTTLNSN